MCQMVTMYHWRSLIHYPYQIRFDTIYRNLLLSSTLEHNSRYFLSNISILGIMWDVQFLFADIYINYKFLPSTFKRYLKICRYAQRVTSNRETRDMYKELCRQKAKWLTLIRCCGCWGREEFCFFNSVKGRGHGHPMFTMNPQTAIFALLNTCFQKARFVQFLMTSPLRWRSLENVLTRNSWLHVNWIHISALRSKESSGVQAIMLGSHTHKN